MSLPVPGEEDNLESQESLHLNDSYQPIMPVQKEPSPPRISESKVPHHVPHVKTSSNVNLSTDLVEANSQISQEEVNMSQNSESPKRRFSSMSVSNSVIQVAYPKSVISYSLKVTNYMNISEKGETFRIP